VLQLLDPAVPLVDQALELVDPLLEPACVLVTGRIRRRQLAFQLVDPRFDR